MSTQKKAKRSADTAIDNDDFERAADKLLAEENAIKKQRFEAKLKKMQEINDKRNQITEHIENFLASHVWNDADMRKSMGEGDGVEFSSSDLSVTIHGEKFYLELTSRKDRD
jgi:hypothetical protein